MNSDNVFSILADSRFVYCGTEYGTARYDKQIDTWEYIGGRQINAIVNDEKYLWWATSEGVTRYDKAAHWRDEYGEKNGLPDVFIKAADIQGQSLWIGTNKGVAKYNTLSDDPNAWETFESALDVDA